jgi:hypothetical protein
MSQGKIAMSAVNPQRSCCFTTKQPPIGFGIILLLLEARHHRVPIPWSSTPESIIAENPANRIWRYLSIVSLSNMAGTHSLETVR